MIDIFNSAPQTGQRHQLTMKEKGHVLLKLLLKTEKKSRRKPPSPSHVKCGAIDVVQNLLVQKWIRTCCKYCKGYDNRTNHAKDVSNQESAIMFSRFV